MRHSISLRSDSVRRLKRVLTACCDTEYSRGECIRNFRRHIEFCEAYRNLLLDGTVWRLPNAAIYREHEVQAAGPVRHRKAGRGTVSKKSVRNPRSGIRYRGTTQYNRTPSKVR